jgi:hypothetical protein
MYVPLPTPDITISTIKTLLTYVPLPLSHRASVISAPIPSVPMTSVPLSTASLYPLLPTTLSPLPISDTEVVHFSNTDKSKTKDPISDEWDPWEATSANSS